MTDNALEPRDRNEAEPTPLLLAVLIGTGISIGCLLIPIVHIVSGPFGPAIGGFFAGSKAKSRGASTLTLGLGIGTGYTLIFTMIALIVRNLTAGESGVTAKLQDAELLWLFLGAIWIWASALATAGAWFGGKASQERASG